MKLLMTIGIMCCVVFCVVAADAKGVTKEIKFKKGSSEATVENCVVRGDRDTYLLGANAGQNMTVTIASEEENAVFQIYKPDGRSTYEKAGEMDDAMKWKGSVSETGSQKIVVGGTRGNACYKLVVGVDSQLRQ